MDNFQIINNKLEKFIKKYYFNELIRGIILFFSIGVLYFLITVFVEHFLWLSITGRTILFWLFILFETSLFVQFICFPIAKLFGLKDGINYLKASNIIGNHFPDVNDKLLNLIQLSENKNSSDLLLASIEQKSNQLKPIPFRLAVDFYKNIKYLKYAAIPITIFLVILFFGKINWIANSYSRVVNYKTAYQPPAPFYFFIINDELSTYENKDFVLQVRASGDLIPENATISFNNEVYFFKNTGHGEFEYTFIQPKEPIEFTINANKVKSIPKVLSVLPVPTLLNFDMKLDYPSYTKKDNEILQSTGNAIIPEGTKVSWLVHTRNTESVDIKTKDTMFSFTNRKTHFFYKKTIYSNLDYEITTSNKNIKNYDNLSFDLTVVKDQYPEINLKSEKDTLDNHTLYFYGRVSDDYGLSNLKLVYYNVNNQVNKKHVTIPIHNSVFDEFVYVFPGNILLENGVDYEFYFEVFDNDQIHNFKSTKSQVFSFRELTDKEKDNKILKEQNQAISGLNKTLKKFTEQENELKSLSKLQKEKKLLDYNDKKKLEDYLKRQKNQETIMKDFSKKLKETLNQSEKNKKEEPFKDALKERLERNEERLKRNEKMLKEIEELADKLQKEELTEKLEDLAKDNKKLKKNLEQLLELTKRFYVIEKHEKLVEKINDLSEKQKELSEKNDEENTKEKQDEINKEFEEFQKEMEELRKQNKDLKKPMNLDQKKEDENDIKKEQKDASDKLEKEEKKEAKKNQKSAAQKMKKMSEGMQMEMQMSGEEQMQEDIEMLRQILDNLVDFSLAQENLMKDFTNISIDNPSYSTKLKHQSVLRENFIHIDDSLYALAVRNPKISEEVTNNLTDIEFNLDKSLERLADNLIGEGTLNQQYTLTKANDLAYLLSMSLDQMQNSIPSPGKGKSGKGEFQLPDIIKKQGELNDKMEKGAKDGKNKGEKEGEGKSGEKGEKKGNKEGGNSSKDGKSKDGDNGEGSDQGEGDNKKNGKGKEKDGDKKEGEFGDQDENINGEIFEIYKQQQELRNALQDKIREHGLDKNIGNGLLQKMEQIEDEMLEKGFNQNTLNKMLELKHQLLKMEEATFQQGEKEEKESTTNQQMFENETNKQLEKAKQYFNTTEILNRQVLPLRQNYKNKVQVYFKKEND